MISLGILRAVRSIVTHGNCPDGLASAVLLHDALPGAEVVFLEYGQRAHRDLVAVPGMLFCDFSPIPERAADFARANAIVLDHHRSAREVVEAMGARGIFADERADPGVAGAVLAYRHVWRPLRGTSPQAAFAEHFATVVGIRDTWQTQSPLWREACAQARLMESMPRDWWLKTPLEALERGWRELEQLGDGLLATHEEGVRRAVARAYRFHSADGHRVVALNTSQLASDAAEALRGEADLIVGFAYLFEGGAPKMHLSLRSQDGAFDCGTFAARFGGGGHTRAAGIVMPVSATDAQPYERIRELVDSVPSSATPSPSLQPP